MCFQRIVLYVAGLFSLAAAGLGKPSSTKTTATPPAITCTSRTKGSHQFCEITGGGSISVVQRNNAPPQVKVLSQNGFVVDPVSPELYSCIEKCFARDKGIHILGASGSRKWQTTITNSNHNLGENLGVNLDEDPDEKPDDGHISTGDDGSFLDKMMGTPAGVHRDFFNDMGTRFAETFPDFTLSNVLEVVRSALKASVQSLKALGQHLLEFFRSERNCGSTKKREVTSSVWSAIFGH
jgi:hypothetical protein